MMLFDAAKYIEAITLAYHCDELNLLFSGDYKYLPSDRRSKAAPKTPDFTCVNVDKANPIDIDAVISAYEYFSRTPPPGECGKLISHLRFILEEMFESNDPVQVYSAARLYLAIKERAYVDTNYNLTPSLPDISLVNECVTGMRDKLENIYLWTGQLYENGLWGALEYYYKYYTSHCRNKAEITWFSSANKPAIAL